MYIKIKRICEVKAPFDLVVENANDWTHFPHLHRKDVAEFRLLYKSGAREIFFYKGRIFHPLPLFKHTIVFREYRPEQSGYSQIYLDISSGRIHYLNGSNIQKGDVVQVIGEFHVSVPDFWRFFPRLIFWAFKRRMRTVMEEDNALMRERIETGIVERRACAPEIPQGFDFYEDLMKKGFQAPAFSFEDHVFSDLAAQNPRPMKS